MKKIAVLVWSILCSVVFTVNLFAQNAQGEKNTVQVTVPEIVNISGAESSWLPGMIQDKFKSNLQDYLGFQTIVDSKSEAAVKKLQAQSEDDARDESTAIELGKLSTAKFALFTKIRKTGKGYSVSADYTDLTTGRQLASATSEEYSSAELLYGSTGAVDQLTLAIANKLGIRISELNKNLLSNGSSDFSIDDQLALAKQNQEQFSAQMKRYDDELSKLMQSNDLASVQNKNKIEAEKALLVQKQESEKKKQQELFAAKQRADADAKLETERSIALKTQRDKMAQEAALKAAEVRKLKLEKQGVLGEINVLEAKKKALLEIRQAIDERGNELYNQLLVDSRNDKIKISKKTYSTVELGSDGKPTEAALKRRENQLNENYVNLSKKFFTDLDSVRNAAQEDVLVSEILADQKYIKRTRTVSSLGDELKVTYGSYEGGQNGWNAYLSLYSDGILLYTDTFIVGYEALSGKKAPDMATEMRDSVIQEYADNVDMYNSLLMRGSPVLYFEVDYTVEAAEDNEPSSYVFNFSNIRVVNTVSGKVVQNSALHKIEKMDMAPVYDINAKNYHKWDYLQRAYNSNTVADYIEKNMYNSEDLVKFLEKLVKFWEEKGVKNIIVIDLDTEDGPKEIKTKGKETAIIVKGDLKIAHYTSLDYETDYFKNLRSEISYGSAKKSGKIHLDLRAARIQNNTIYEGAFRYLDSLKSVYLPDDVQIIEKDAFSSCERLQYIELPKSLLKMGDDVFRFCESLKKIHIPESVSEVGKDVFLSCDYIKIEIPLSMNEELVKKMSSCCYTSTIIRY